MNRDHYEFNDKTICSKCGYARYSLGCENECGNHSPKVKVINQMPKTKIEPQHPLYPVLTHQIGASVIIARLIAMDNPAAVTPQMQKFLELFDKQKARAVVK